jgi:hypothetical protein
MPNEYFRRELAKNYIRDRNQFEESWQLLKQMKKSKPSRFYRAVFSSIVSIGRLLIAIGRRLEKFDLVLIGSKVKP